jgi:hypothetical protein
VTPHLQSRSSKKPRSFNPNGQIKGLGDLTAMLRNSTKQNLETRIEEGWMEKVIFALRLKMLWKAYKG